MKKLLEFFFDKFLNGTVFFNALLAFVGWYCILIFGWVIVGGNPRGQGGKPSFFSFEEANMIFFTLWPFHILFFFLAYYLLLVNRKK